MSDADSGPDDVPPGPPTSSALDAKLAPLRARIDQIDQQLVQLMNERANVALEVGQTKKAHSGEAAAFYVPAREKLVLDKIRQLNAGPLPNRSLDAIWREIMSGSVKLQTPLRIAYLGPAGSFSHAAAVGKFGSSVDYVTSADIDSVFSAVSRGHADYGLVPVENSTHGGVVDTLDAFMDHSPKVCAEVLITIHHNLMATGPWEQVSVVSSKPEVFTQCRQWLANVARGKEIRPAASTSTAVQEASADPSIAAIGSRLASEVYDVPILFDNIEDDPDNVTRFWVIGREPSKPSGDDKTGVLFTTANKPGALVEVLDAFKSAGINLTDIEKRPSGRTNWEYVFFVDAEGHADTPEMQAAIKAARQHCLQLTVLGSYPRAAEVL